MLPGLTYKLYIDWNNDGTFSGPYDDVTDRVRGVVTIDRGQSGVNGAFAPGTIEFNLDNSDKRFSNDASPVIPGLVIAGRPIKFIVAYPVTGEAIGATDGSGDLNKILSKLPIYPSTLHIFNSSQIETAKDNGSGMIIPVGGSGASGTINYTSGYLKLYGSTPNDAHTANYGYETSRFTGRCNLFQPGMGTIVPQVYASGSDLLDYYSSKKFSIQIGAGQTFTQMLTSIFNKISLTDYAIDQLLCHTLQNDCVFIAQTFDTVLSTIATACHGYFYMGRDGVLQFKSFLWGECWYYQSPSGAVERPLYNTYYTDELHDDVIMNPSDLRYGGDEIRNRILIQDDKSITWPLNDTTSQNIYGIHEQSLGNSIISAMSTEDILKLANYWISYYKDLYRTGEVTIKEIYPDVLDVDLGERIKIVDAQTGLDTEFVVLGYNEQIDVKGSIHTVKYRLRQRRYGAFSGGQSWGTGSTFWEMSQLENGYDEDGRYYEIGQKFTPEVLLNIPTRFRFDLESESIPANSNGNKIVIYNSSLNKLVESEPFKLEGNKRQMVSVDVPLAEVSNYGYAVVEWVDGPADKIILADSNPYYPHFTECSGGACWSIGKLIEDTFNNYYKIRKRFLAFIDGAIESITVYPNTFGLGPVGVNLTYKIPVGLKTTVKDSSNNIIAQSGRDMIYSTHDRLPYKINFINQYGKIEAGREYIVEFEPWEDSGHPYYYPFTPDKYNYYTLNGSYVANPATRPAELFIESGQWLQETRHWVYGTAASSTFMGWGVAGYDTRRSQGTLLKLGPCALTFWKILVGTHGDPYTRNYTFNVKAYDGDIQGLTRSGDDVSEIYSSPAYKFTDSTGHIISEACDAKIGRFLVLNVEGNFNGSYYDAYYRIRNDYNYDYANGEGDDSLICEARHIGQNVNDTWSGSGDVRSFDAIALTGYFNIYSEIAFATGGKLKIYGDPNFYSGGNAVGKTRSGGETIWDLSGLSAYDLNFGFEVE